MNFLNTLSRATLLLAALGALVLLNLASLTCFGRLDLTHDRQFTLSEATAATLEELEEPATVTAYFTENLPAPFSGNARYLRDLLEEYKARGAGKLRYEFVDPAGESDASEGDGADGRDIFGGRVREQSALEKELAGLGIQPVQVRVNEGDNLTVKRAYMGVVVRIGEARAAIPAVQSTEGLEYDLTTTLRKLAREKSGRRPRVALITEPAREEDPQAESPLKDLGRALGVIGQLYDLVPLDFGARTGEDADDEDADAAPVEIPADVDALLVYAPRTAMREEQLRALDAFIGAGGAAAFLLNAIETDLQNLKFEENEHGLQTLLETYGVRIAPGLVLDTECANINVTTQQGFVRIQQQVRYPFLLQPRAVDSDSPLTRGIGSVILPFMSPLRVNIAEDDPVRASVLVRSSRKSWVHEAPYDLNPQRRWLQNELGEQRRRNLFVTLEGALPSAYETEAAPREVEFNEDEGADADDERTPRVAVVGGADFITDNFFSPGNEALLLNLMDWLVRDDALLAVRTRGLRAAPLEELSETRRSTIKWTNIVGVPLALIAFGLIRWRIRETRRTKIHLPV